MNKIKAQAALQGISLSKKVENLLYLALAKTDGKKTRTTPPKLPSFSMGEAFLDVADRNALYDLLDRK